MPELPEVEAARRDLTRWLGGRRITAVIVLDPTAIRAGLSTRPSAALPGGPQVVEGAVGAEVVDVRRHGKRLGVVLARGSCWLAHLGMTGQFVRADEAPRFARLGVVAGEVRVWFADARRFGCVAPIDRGALAAALAEAHGPDGLDADPATWAPGLVGRRALKVALMDQAVVAGVGNIHAVEILWRLRLHPDTRCDRLDPAIRLQVAAETQRELAETVAGIDGDPLVYVNQGGANPFVVYQREGEPCPRCGSAIEAGRHSGRATFWCPTCQPAPSGVPVARVPRPVT